MADIAFTAYAFKSDIGSYGGTDTRVDRTTLDRLGEVVNVKDWGAVGDGVTDDTAAIQAAYDHACAYIGGDLFRHGCPVFFPPGTYRIDSGPIELQGTTYAGGNYVCLWGSGRDSTILKGLYNGGFLFRKSADSGDQIGDIRDLTFWNESVVYGTGALQIQCEFIAIHLSNLRFVGYNGYTESHDCYNMTMENCIATSSVPMRAASVAPPTNYVISGTSSQTVNGGIGIAIIQGEIINCHVYNFDVGFAISGVGLSINGMSAHRCGIGLWVGCPPYLSSSNPLAGGMALAGGWFERCRWALRQNNASGNSTYACTQTGDTGPFDPSTISGIVFGSGTATVTTSVAHNLPTGTTNLTLITNPVGWTPDGTGHQIVPCLKTGTNTFTYSLSSAPGSFASATWNYPMEYGISLLNSVECIWGAIDWQAPVASAAFDALYGGAGAGTQSNNYCMAMLGAGGYLLPDGSSVQSGLWRFTSCGVVGHAPPVAFQKLAGAWGFEGTQYDIIDAQSQTLGGIVTGGGSNHYRVRFDGTNWIRIG